MEWQIQFMALPQGSPKQVGEELVHCASRVGWDMQTKMHGVGDGASWIANQFEEKFGANGASSIYFTLESISLQQARAARVIQIPGIKR